MHTLTDFQPETETAEVACQTCRHLFTARLFTVGTRTLHVHNCQSCAEVAAVETERLRLAEREAAWLDVCRSEYRDCDPTKLPTDAARQALQAAAAWNPHTGGWSVVGRQSGQGKTRIVHAAAKPHFLAGLSVVSVNCALFGQEVAARFERELRDWLKPMRKAAILILDDLGKERADPRVAGALYSIVEYRTSGRRPILFTSNYAGDELAERLGEQGPYIVRRLREFCRGVVL